MSQRHSPREIANPPTEYVTFQGCHFTVCGCGLVANIAMWVFSGHYIVENNISFSAGARERLGCGVASPDEAPFPKTLVVRLLSTDETEFIGKAERPKNSPDLNVCRKRKS